MWQDLIVAWFHGLHRTLFEQIRKLYLVFGEQPLQVQQILITHVQLAAAGKDVDQRVVEDQLYRFGKFQVLHVAYKLCPGARVEDLKTSIRYLAGDAEPGVPEWIVFGTIAMHYVYQITNFK